MMGQGETRASELERRLMGVMRAHEKLIAEKRHDERALASLKRRYNANVERLAQLTLRQERFDRTQKELEAAKAENETLRKMLLDAIGAKVKSSKQNT